ncbi:hypothetical protein SAMN05192588_1589 [Nonlabens sp. Hel1_33_55]|uniref:hypothetical protein n=1 Tax=Nonlabens sp. Hel1_33_55 TaxID=1336802 RepID=UPI000875EBF7|nr:hypothetical protein [Nonlabens sp. Hel1_33_55]SCY19034.1 hypothetical protein SAMN05192588_1589 [Nonlabens sp. Hel1_33_55]
MSKSKGGRPRIKCQKEVRKVRINLSFNQNEKEAIDMFCKKYNHINQSKGAFLRDVLMEIITSNKVTVVEYISPYDINELNRIGVNLNQVCKKIQTFPNLGQADQQRIYQIIHDISKIIYDR